RHSATAPAVARAWPRWRSRRSQPGGRTGPRVTSAMGGVLRVGAVDLAVRSGARSVSGTAVKDGYGVRRAAAGREGWVSCRAWLGSGADLAYVGSTSEVAVLGLWSARVDDGRLTWSRVRAARGTR